ETRQEFWLGYIGLIAAEVVLIRALPNPLLYNSRGRSWDLGELEFALKWPVTAAVLIVGWPLIAVVVKRLHDFNVSGWWMAAVLAFPSVAKLLGINLLLLYLLAIVLLGLFAGTAGDNRFGSDPLARRRT
ncbi:MAG: DUF805 domain-containing protein, partial [Bradyrhizobium sp.]